MQHGVRTSPAPPDKASANAPPQKRRMPYFADLLVHLPVLNLALPAAVPLVPTLGAPQYCRFAAFAALGVLRQQRFESAAPNNNNNNNNNRAEQ